MSQKVKIQYGVWAGERLGSGLRRALRRAGYHITKDAATADIIMAHSAGCFWLPKAPTHQKLVLIDPPYWPERTIKERARARAKTNFRFRQYGYSYLRWLKRNLWGWYYAVRDLRRTSSIVRQAQHYDLSEIIKNHQVLLIRNQHDDWLTPELTHLKHINPQLKIFELPGDHEDWYHRPQPYVDLIKSVYGAGQ